MTVKALVYIYYLLLSSKLKKNLGRRSIERERERDARPNGERGRRGATPIDQRTAAERSKGGLFIFFGEKIIFLDVICLC